MPCNADTIVKIKVVKETEKEKLLVVWAIGVYPVGDEDHEIELVMFVPVKAEERDLATQVIFERDEYFSVGGKIVPEYYNNNIRPRMTVSTSTHLKILNKVSVSNKCPLKVSLVGVVGEVPKFKNEEDAIIKVSITDYSRRDYNFIVTVVFRYLDSRFKGLASLIRPRESVVFVVGQMEIIENVLYVFGQDNNLVNTWFESKKREYDINNETPLELTNSARSKLLSIHKNICKEKGSEEIYKHVKVEEMDENAEYIFIDENGNSSNTNNDNDYGLENEVDSEVNQEDEVKKKKSKNKKNSGCKKGNDRVVRTVIHNTRKSSKLKTDVNDNDSK